MKKQRKTEALPATQIAPGSVPDDRAKSAFLAVMAELRRKSVEFSGTTPPWFPAQNTWEELWLQAVAEEVVA
jgi:hypothetical protein